MFATQRRWPLAQLSIDCGNGLELRYPSEDDLFALADVAARGIHDPSAVPFNSGWSNRPPSERATGLLQYHWGRRAEWRPDCWALELAVVDRGTVAGVQSLFAEDFAVSRTAASGSWLGRAFHGRGLGTRMRSAILSFGFS